MTPLDLDPTSSLVVRTVLRYGPIPRKAIADRTGLSSGSLTRLSKPLVQRGLLRELPTKPVGTGRPTQPLEIVDEAAYFLGIKVIAGELHAVLTGLAGDVHESVVRQIDTSTPASAVAAIADLVAEIGSQWPVHMIGVSLAATVDDDGWITASKLLGWPRCNIEQEIESATNITCVAANDVDALTLSQHWFGHGRGLRNFAVVTVGAGVGAGAVMGDELVVGHQGISGMVSYMWSGDGRTFEDVLTTTAFENDMRSGDAETVIAQAVGVLVELVKLVGLMWGPERILITGEGIGQFMQRLGDVQQAFHERWPKPLDPPELRAEELEFLDWAQGAAALALHRSLTS